MIGSKGMRFFDIEFAFIVPDRARFPSAEPHRGIEDGPASDLDTAAACARGNRALARVVGLSSDRAGIWFDLWLLYRDTG